MTRTVSLDDIRDEVGSGLYNSWVEEGRRLYEQGMRREKHKGGRITGIEPRTPFVSQYVREKYIESMFAQDLARQPAESDLAVTAA